MRDDAAPGPLTLALAPQAPGRLGREDARNFGCGTLEKAEPPQQIRPWSKEPARGCDVRDGDSK